MSRSLDLDVYVAIFAPAFNDFSYYNRNIHPEQTGSKSYPHSPGRIVGEANWLILCRYDNDVLSASYLARSDIWEFGWE